MQHGSKVSADDALPAPEDLLPFNDVQAELCRLVTELTWPAVDLSFFRKSRRDRATGKLRQDVDVFAECLPCGVTLGCPARSEAVVPTLTIAADRAPSGIGSITRRRGQRRRASSLARQARCCLRGAGERNAV